jgi:hypothetical protein
MHHEADLARAPERLSEQPHHVEFPQSKRPCDGDGLKRSCQEVSLSSIELAALLGSHDILGVRHCCGPVKSLSESFSDKSSQTGVMSTCCSMHLVKRLFVLIFQNAAHEYACCTSLVKLTLNEDERFSPSRNVTCLCLVEGQLPLDKPLKDGDVPV